MNYHSILSNWKFYKPRINKKDIQLRLNVSICLLTTISDLASSLTFTTVRTQTRTLVNAIKTVSLTANRLT